MKAVYYIITLGWFLGGGWAVGALIFNEMLGIILVWLGGLFALIYLGIALERSGKKVI